MEHGDELSRVMFWVGAMFVFTPILVVAIVLGTNAYLRRKRGEGGQPAPRDQAT